MVKVYTKKGDKGLTSLYSGERVNKNNPIFNTLGTIDELQVAIADVIFAIGHGGQRDYLRTLQKLLIQISSDIATSPFSSRYQQVIFPESRITELETHIDNMDYDLPKLTKFILVGSSSENVKIHQCRVLARKAERYVCVLSNINPNVLKFLNRISDYFFVLARYYTWVHKEEEIEN